MIEPHSRCMPDPLRKEEIGTWAYVTARMSRRYPGRIHRLRLCSSAPYRTPKRPPIALSGHDDPVDDISHSRRALRSIDLGETTEPHRYCVVFSMPDHAMQGDQAHLPRPPGRPERVNNPILRQVRLAAAEP